MAISKQNCFRFCLGKNAWIQVIYCFQNQFNTPLVRILAFSACNAVESAVLQNSVTVSEMDSVHLSCSTIPVETASWHVRTVLHEEHDRRIMNYTSGWDDEFTEVERFSVTYQEGFYNLTIANVTITDAGEYHCIESDGYGNTSTVSLNVYG